MHSGWRVLAMAVVLLGAACSRDKNQPEQARATATPTPPPTVAAVAGDCFAGLRAYRYTGKLDIKLPPSLGGANLRDIAITGVQVNPDRNQTSLRLAEGALELITIGPDVWVKTGDATWQKNPPDVGLQITINPGDICRATPAELERLGVAPVRESVNGVATLRYTADKSVLSRANGGFGGAAGVLTALFDSVTLTLWVSEQERRPVRIALAADQSGAEAITLRAEFTVTDHNQSDIVINPPN